MNAPQLTTSAALFFNAADDAFIPLGWFEKAVELFRIHGFSPILFAGRGGDFALDDCYVLADRGGDIEMWGEIIRARRQDLIHALESGKVSYLGLDSPHASARDRSDWCARVSVSSRNGELYVGIDESFISGPVELLRCVYDWAGDLFDVRYGIAYTMPLIDSPDSYASGYAKTSPSDAFEMIRHRSDWDSRKKVADELWAEERNGKRRYLDGLYRGAYPCSMLSASHVRAAGLTTQGIGRVTELANSLWLWELSEAEIPMAQAMLEERRLLVSQAV